MTRSDSLHESLVDLERFSTEHYSSFLRSSEKVQGENSTVVGLDSKKINSVKKILDFFNGQAFSLSQVPSPPFADNHGPCDLFESSLSCGGLVPFDTILRDAASDFSLDSTPSTLADSEKQLELESQSVLGDWDYFHTVMKRIAELHQVSRFQDSL